MGNHLALDAEIAASLSADCMPDYHHIAPGGRPDEAYLQVAAGMVVCRRMVLHMLPCCCYRPEFAEDDL